MKDKRNKITKNNSKVIIITTKTLKFFLVNAMRIARKSPTPARNRPLNVKRLVMMNPERTSSVPVIEKPGFLSSKAMPRRNIVAEVILMPSRQTIVKILIAGRTENRRSKYLRFSRDTPRDSNSNKISGIVPRDNRLKPIATYSNRKRVNTKKRS